MAQSAGNVVMGGTHGTGRLLGRLWRRTGELILISCTQDDTTFRRELRASGLLRSEKFPYRRCGTTYRSHLQGPRIPEDGTDRLSRNVVRKLPLIAA